METEFRMEEKQERRYTHYNPKTGEWWDNLEGRWVMLEDPEEDDLK